MPRAATPIAIHRLRGSYRKNRHADKFSPPAEGIGPAPDWFDEPMKAEWERIASHPVLRLVLNTAHRPTIEHHCVLYKRFLEDARGERTMTASERQTFHSIQMQLGWTPASQSKVPAPQAEKPDSPWAKLANK